MTLGHVDDVHLRANNDGTVTIRLTEDGTDGFKVLEKQLDATNTRHLIARLHDTLGLAGWISRPQDG